jgi:hypothetical protein
MTKISADIAHHYRIKSRAMGFGGHALATDDAAYQQFNDHASADRRIRVICPLWIR